MPTTTPTSHVLVIAGMHRSGTSLLANWLQQCGLNIGEELVPAGVGNPLGHFEDTEFLNFHQAVLKENHLETLVTNQEIDISEAQYQTAVGIAAKRSALPQWGWKDPRTCLFMGLWKDVIPEAAVLCIFRHPAEVVDSFRRRALHKKRQAAGTDSDPQKPSLRQQIHDFITLGFSFGHQVRVVRFYLHAWTRHNQELMRFAQEHPDDILFLQTRDLQKFSTPIVNFMDETWGFTLHPIDFKQVYEPTMMTRRRSIFYKFAIFVLSPSSTLTYRQMMLYRTESVEKFVKAPAQAHRILPHKPRSTLQQINHTPDRLHFSHPGAA